MKVVGRRQRESGRTQSPPDSRRRGAYVAVVENEQGSISPRRPESTSSGRSVCVSARTGPRRWIMASERGEFAGKGGLVEGEYDDGQIALVTETVEQRLQREHIVGRGRDIAALVPAEERFAAESRRSLRSARREEKRAPGPRRRRARRRSWRTEAPWSSRTSTIMAGTIFFVGAVTPPDAPEKTRTFTPGCRRAGTASPTRFW